MSLGLARSFRAEWVRTLGTPGGRLALALPPLAAALRVVLGRAFEGAERARSAARAAVLGADPTGVELSSNAYPPFAAGVAVGLGTAAVLLLAYGAVTIAGERDSGTMRAALVRPVSRGAYVLGKVVVGVLLAVAALPAILAASALAAGAFYDFGPIVDQGFPIWSAAEVRHEVVRGVSAGALAVLAVFAFGVLVSSLARSAGPALVAAMLGYLLFDALKGILGRASEYVFATFAPSLVDRSYLGEVAKFAQGYSDAGYGPGTWTRNLVVPPVQAVAFVLVAILATRRRDA